MGMDKNAEKAHRSGFAVCAALFVCGCAIGVAAAASLPPEAGVADYLTVVKENYGAGFGERFVSALLSAGRYHAAALFFAFSALGVVGLPALTALRGFLLCFSMSALVRCGGSASLPTVLALFAPEALIAVPCLFIISSQSFTSSLTLLRTLTKRAAKTSFPYGGGFIGRCAVCAAALAASSLITALVVPMTFAQ
jgi:hypothetical protein